MDTHPKFLFFLILNLVGWIVPHFEFYTRADLTINIP